MNSPAAPRAQRVRLGRELRRTRILAGMSGREVASRIGIGQASVSRIENAQTVPSLPEVRDWAEATGVPKDVRASLEVLAEAALNEVETWRARQGVGLASMQDDVRALAATARTVRNFQPTIVPGLLQTAEYARRVFSLVDVVGEDDYTAAVAARVERQQALYDETKTFEFIITEAALRWRPGPPTVLLAQLDRLRSIATLNNVSIGVLPVNTDVGAIAWCGFNIYEDNDEDHDPFVRIETPHAGMTISDPADVSIYRELLSAIRQAAIFHREMNAFLVQIADDIQK